MAIDRSSLPIVEKMWRREVEAAATYRHLAEREKDPRRRDILNRLADQETNHADRWAERIEAATGTRPDKTGIEQGLTWFQRISDPNVVLHRLEQEENRAEAEYDVLVARLTDPEDKRIAEEAKVEEADHAVILRSLAGCWLGLGPAGGALLVLGTAGISVLGQEREQRALLRWNAPAAMP